MERQQLDAEAKVEAQRKDTGRCREVVTLELRL